MSAKSYVSRKRRQRRVRRKISGTGDRPRLNVFRSLNHIYAQVIDDVAGHTLVSASTVDVKLTDVVSGKTKKEQAEAVGKAVAERALAVGIEQVVFDRAGFRYHGRIKSLADAAREGGLKF
jgi:large subunit ribosomal protein L18